MKRNLQILSLLLTIFVIGAVYWQLLLGTSVEDETLTEVDTVEESFESEREDVDVAQSETPTENLTNIGRYTIKEVVDGDTVRIWDGSELFVVRVLGIDAPETEHSPTGAECFNKEATAYADELLTGRTVNLITDGSQDTFDAYGRLLAYIELADGRDFGREMLYGGYAEEYTFKGVAYAKQADYQAVEAVAEEGGIGLWSCD